MIIVRIGLGITSTSGETGETLANSTSHPLSSGPSKNRPYGSVQLGTFVAQTRSIESMDPPAMEPFQSKEIERSRV